MAKSVRAEYARRVKVATETTMNRAREASRAAKAYADALEHNDRLSKQYLQLIVAKVGGLDGYNAIMKKAEKHEIKPGDPEWEAMKLVVAFADRLGEVKGSLTTLENDRNKARRLALEALKEEEAAEKRLAEYKEEKKELVKYKRTYKDWKKRLRTELFGKV
jgi:hypothetical protein